MAKKLISDQLREAIKHCGKTRYRIYKETGIPESQLSRFYNNTGVSLSLNSIDKLCECIGADLVLRIEPSQRTASTKRPKKR